jgi:hypothetical protein
MRRPFIKEIRGFFLSVALLVLPATASAQSAPNRFDVVERVASACPGLILQDHAFTDAVASLLTAEDARWGRNGKRGNPNDPSHDAIAFRNQSSPFGVSIVDIIGAAGSSSASPAWIDQTQATIDARTTGVWVAPSGRLPACLSGGSEPPLVVTPPLVVSPPALVVDLGPVLEKLSAIEARIAALEARPAPVTELGLFGDYVDDMVGTGPGGGEPNHVTDMKTRLDVIRMGLEQLAAWLKSRPVLRF